MKQTLYILLIKNLQLVLCDHFESMTFFLLKKYATSANTKYAHAHRGPAFLARTTYQQLTEK